ncbi:recombinase family protein [Paracoccus sp. SJTW-4]|uniref:recombinase family protein n=1 Tax=Paracoccus sp. SJTW-4 TaxID=3078428 RepID=UPI0039E8B0B7
MKQFVTYRRVSTAGQGRSGLGLEAQDRDIRLYLDNYADVPHEVLAEFLEVQSGADGDRPELSKALDLCRRTGAELLVAKLDRLSRRVSFIAALMDDPKVKLRVASMPNADKFQLHIYAALAEQERDFISMRTKAALGAAKARGVKLGGNRDVLLQRAEAVRRDAQDFARKVAPIVQPLRTSGATLTTIAEALDGAGIATARGGKWTATQVKRVLDRL